MHRDIKTENILLTRDGIVKIADFGLTRRMVDPSVTSLRSPKYTNNVVTLWYRAPEIILGDTKYTDRIDLWSVGCILGEFWQRDTMLKGQNEYNQLELISTLCGTIDQISLPNAVHLKSFQSMKMPGPFQRRTRSYLSTISNLMSTVETNNFFDTLLEINPEIRHSAWSAINDMFFFSPPLPTTNLRDFMARCLNVFHSSYD